MTNCFICENRAEIKREAHNNVSRAAIEFLAGTEVGDAARIMYFKIDEFKEITAVFNDVEITMKKRKK